MRCSVLAAALLAAGCLPHRATEPRAPSPRERAIRVVSAPTIRTVSAPTIRSVSARGIEPVIVVPGALADRGRWWTQLPGPHRAAPGAEPAAPPLREAADLRVRVGMRDSRDPVSVVLGWRAELNLAALSGADGASLVAAAETGGLLRGPRDAPAPGDLLVFDRAVTGDRSDLVALAIARDARGVTEFVYAGGGVIRRGYVDAERPSLRRDRGGAIVNTFLRHGKRWPPEGTKYLAGELLAHVIVVR